MGDGPEREDPGLMILGTTSLAEKGGSLASTLPAEAVEFLGLRAKGRLLWAIDRQDECLRVYNPERMSVKLGERNAGFRGPEEQGEDQGPPRA